MSETTDPSFPEPGSRELSPEEARRLRARLLAAQEAADANPPGGSEHDPAEASLATLILPGG